jgi:hypothetical protein
LREVFSCPGGLIPTFASLGYERRANVGIKRQIQSIRFNSKKSAGRTGAIRISETKGHESNSQWSTGNGSSIITQCCIPYRVKPVNDALNSSFRIYSLVATVKSGLISVQQLINHRKEAALVI